MVDESVSALVSLRSDAPVVRSAQMGTALSVVAALALVRPRPCLLPSDRPWKTLADEIGIGQALAVDSAGNPCEPSRVGVLALVESERLLVQIAEQMERFDADIGALDGPLEQAPEVLQSVCVDLALGVPLGVVDDLVDVCIAELGVGLERIGVDLGTGRNVLADFGAERMAAHVGDDLSPHGAMPIGSVTLQQAHNSDLAHAASSDVLALGFVLETSLSADVGLIDFDVARELVASGGLHDQADALEHEPGRFLSHADRTCNLIGTNAVLGVGKQPDRRQPLVESDRRVLEDRSDLDRELAPRVLVLALPQAPSGDEADPIGPAGRTNHATIGPAQFDHIVEANIGVREVSDRLDQSLRLTAPGSHALSVLRCLA